MQEGQAQLLRVELAAIKGGSKSKWHEMALAENARLHDGMEHQSASDRWRDAREYPYSTDVRSLIAAGDALRDELVEVIKEREEALAALGEEVQAHGQTLGQLDRLRAEFCDCDQTEADNVALRAALVHVKQSCFPGRLKDIAEIVAAALGDTPPGAGHD
jgi:hypothetical protein